MGFPGLSSPNGASDTEHSNCRQSADRILKGCVADFGFRGRNHRQHPRRTRPLTMVKDHMILSPRHGRASVETDRSYKCSARMGPDPSLLHSIMNIDRWNHSSIMARGP